MLALNNTDKGLLSGTKRSVIYLIIVQIQLQSIRSCYVSILIFQYRDRETIKLRKDKGFQPCATNFQLLIYGPMGLYING